MFNSKKLSCLPSAYKERRETSRSSYKESNLCIPASWLSEKCLPTSLSIVLCATISPEQQYMLIIYKCYLKKLLMSRNFIGNSLLFLFAGYKLKNQFIHFIGKPHWN